jgi:hypothetical protein
MPCGDLFDVKFFIIVAFLGKRKEAVPKIDSLI